jgi:hypothetical protein
MIPSLIFGTTTAKLTNFPELLQTPAPNTSLIDSQAWDIDFRGDHHDFLKQHITRAARKRNRTSSEDKAFVTFVQSSGTGKSRMVKELSKTIFTLPFCFRDRRNPSGELGFSVLISRKRDVDQDTQHLMERRPTFSLL